MDSSDVALWGSGKELQPRASEMLRHLIPIDYSRN